MRRRYAQDFSAGREECHEWFCSLITSLIIRGQGGKRAGAGERSTPLCSGVLPLDKSESCEVLDVAPDGEAPTNLPRSRIAPYPPPSRLCLFVISKRNGSKTLQRPHYPWQWTDKLVPRLMRAVLLLPQMGSAWSPSPSPPSHSNICCVFAFCV